MSITRSKVYRKGYRRCSKCFGKGKTKPRFKCLIGKIMSSSKRRCRSSERTSSIQPWQSRRSFSRSRRCKVRCRLASTSLNRFALSLSSVVERRVKLCMETRSWAKGAHRSFVISRVPQQAKRAQYRLNETESSAKPPSSDSNSHQSRTRPCKTEEHFPSAAMEA
jgi:hypothetical protein